MVTEIKGFGARAGHTEIYRDAKYVVNFVSKVKLERVIADSVADQMVEVITGTAKTGKIDDAKSLCSMSSKPCACVQVRPARALSN